MRFYLPFLLVISFYCSKGDTFFQVTTSTTDSTFESLLTQAREIKSTNRDAALKLADQALNYAQKESSIDFELRVYSLLGDIEISNSNYSRALEHLQVGLQKTARAKDLTHVAKLHNQVAVVYHYQSRFDLSLEHYLNALTIYERLGQPLDVSKVLGNIGIIYYMMRDLDAAEDHYRKAIVLQEQLGEREMLIKNYINLGGIYQEHKKSDSALYSYNKALQVADAIGEEKTKGPLLHNIGLLYADRQDFSTAEKFMQEALVIHRKYNDKHLIAQSEIEMADFYRNQKQLDKAEKLYHQAILDAKESESLALEAQAYRSLTELFKLQNRSEQALLYQEKFYVLKDSIFSREANATIQSLRVRYETEKKEKEIETLSDQAAVQRKLVWVSALAAVLGFGLLIISIVTYRLRHQHLMQRTHVLEGERNQAVSEKVQAREDEKRVKQDHDRLTEDVEHKKRELASNVILINQKNEILLTLKEKLESISEQSAVPEKSMRDLVKLIGNALNQEESWETLKAHFENVHPKFFTRLLANCPDLTPSELRHCAYMKMNIQTKDVANMLNVNAETVRMSRYRIKKKLNLPADDDLHQFIFKLD